VSEKTSFRLLQELIQHLFRTLHSDDGLNLGKYLGKRVIRDHSALTSSIFDGFEVETREG